jgi:hypothetical protein
MANRHLELLRRLPLTFVPLLLRELAVYDWKFPAERQDLDWQLDYLASLSAESLRQVMAPFEAIELPAAFGRSRWVESPAAFSEELTAHLWSTHQIGPFRAAAAAFMRAFRAAVPPLAPGAPRLTIAVIGKDASGNSYPLFRKLRPYGTHHQRVNPTHGLRILLDRVAARAKAHPAPFLHWYIDGGAPEAVSSDDLTQVSWASMASARAAVIAKMRTLLASRKTADARRTALAQMRPEEAGLPSSADAILRHFKLSLLVEGSGTQFFSTTFVQWSAREILRRAQPLTLLARFAPRQTERAMDIMLAGGRNRAALDAEGALIDADMGAYYTWLNHRRLMGASQSSFLVWFENHAEALLISPWSPPGTESHSPTDLRQLLDQHV